MPENQTEPIEDMMRGRFLTFAVGEEAFGIEIRLVKEIIGIQPINTLPDVPEYIRGVINLRGKIIPVIDMRLKFRKKPIDYTDRTCIIVVDMDDFSVGLIVDQVSEVVSMDSEDIVPPPDKRTGIQNKYIQGIGKASGEVKLLLDCEKLFMGNEIDTLGQISMEGLQK